MFYWLVIASIWAYFCVVATANEEYEVDDDVAILVSGYRKTEGTQSYITYLFAIGVVSVIGMVSVYYVRFTWKERFDEKVQNLHQNMANYAVISRQAHQEEVTSLRRKHNKELSDIKMEKDKRIHVLATEKKSTESKLYDTKGRLERCQWELSLVQDEKQNLIRANKEEMNKKDREIWEVKSTFEEIKAENYTLHSTVSSWESRAKDLQLAMKTMEHKNANLQREIDGLKKKAAGSVFSMSRLYQRRHPAETTETSYASAS